MWKTLQMSPLCALLFKNDAFIPGCWNSSSLDLSGRARKRLSLPLLLLLLLLFLVLKARRRRTREIYIYNTSVRKRVDPEGDLLDSIIECISLRSNLSRSRRVFCLSLSTSRSLGKVFERTLWHERRTTKRDDDDDDAQKRTRRRL